MLEVEFNDLINTAHEISIKQDIDNSRFESIKDIEIFDRTIKSKWFIFPITKKQQIVKVTVDETLYFAEILADDLRIKRYIDKYIDYKYELEIEYAE